MFLFLVSLAFSYNLQGAFTAAWNVEVIEPEIDGKIKSTEFYNFNLTQTEEEGVLNAEIFEGNFSGGNESDLEEKKLVDSFELIFENQHSGQVIFHGKEASTFRLEESFPHFLAGYGTFNGYSYAVNIVNLATIHVTLYSFDNKIFKEFLLTQYQRPVQENWYDKFKPILVGIAGFAIMTVVLRYGGVILDFFGLSGKDRIKTVYEALQQEKNKKE